MPLFQEYYGWTELPVPSLASRSLQPLDAPLPVCYHICEARQASRTLLEEQPEASRGERFGGIMKNRALRLSAYFLEVLAIITAIAGLAITLIIAIGATTLIARAGFILAGFILTAVSAMILLAVSQLLFLFIRIEEDLARLAAALKSKTGD